MRHGAHEVLEELPGWCNTVIGDLLSHLSKLDERIVEYDGHVQRAAKENERARQLMRLAVSDRQLQGGVIRTQDVGTGSAAPIRDRRNRTFMALP